MKKEKIYEWFDLAELCEENYGIQVDYEEKFFICCDCNEPIYYDDWKDDKHFLKDNVLFVVMYGLKTSSNRR